MTKATKKKRNKPYRGEDAAAPDTPVVRRYTAVERNKLSQWWFEKKRIAKPVGIGLGILVIAVWFFSEALRIIF
jgi:hypothetical protein